MGWPLSRPRCAVSGAEHALSAGERRGFSGGPPGGCAPAGSSAVGPPFVCRPPLSLGRATTASIHAPRPAPPSPRQQRGGGRQQQHAGARPGTAGGGTAADGNGGRKGKKGTGGGRTRVGSPLRGCSGLAPAAKPPGRCRPPAGMSPAGGPPRGQQSPRHPSPSRHPRAGPAAGLGAAPESPLYTHIGDSFVWGGGEPPKSPPAELRHPRGAEGVRQRLRRARFLGFWPLPGSPSAIRRQGCFREPSQDVSRAFCPPRAAAGTGWGCLP